MPGQTSQRVLVTGGSSGIGRSIALAAAARGASVTVAARRPGPLDETLVALRAAAPSDEQRFFAHSLDVADRAAVGAAAPTILGELGGLDLLVNNAGISHVGYLADEDGDAYERLMRVNYLSAVWVTQAFLPHFTERGSGHIVFVSSVLGCMGLFGYSAYAASKHALVGYADSIRQDLLTSNVGVHVLFPADTDTPQLREENRTKPAETAAVSGTIKPASPDAVAAALFAGLDADRPHIVPGLGTRLTLGLVRHLPGLARRVMDRDVRRAAAARAGGDAR